MERKLNRKLILETGEIYEGYAFGGKAERVCELVFHTTMLGYQDIVYDSCYTDLAVVMTYPLIGNYGVTDEEYESKIPGLGAMIVGEYNDLPSSFRCTKSLSEVLEDYEIPGLELADTRALTKRIRNGGVCRVLITDRMELTAGEGQKIIADTELRRDAVARVSCRKRFFARTPDHTYKIVAVDCGIKNAHIRALNLRGCNLTVMPYSTTAEAILSIKPDGLFISSGPGNPEDLPEVVELIRTLKGTLPILGISLGHQLISLACGAKIYKMKNGHRGDNHPIRDLETGIIRIGSQNHGYAVDEASLAGTGLTVSHINVLDKTVEGVKNRELCLFGAQFVPEAATENPEVNNVYDQFIECMKERKCHA